MKQMLAFLDWLADHKGAPVLLGIVLVVANFVVVVFAGEGWAARTNVLLHVGIVVALFGELLAAVL